MKPITREMIETFNINKLKYDFMGYTFRYKDELSFHHLVIPKRECKSYGLGEGYLLWNGAILKQETSHDYLHLIERVDRKYFSEITNIMIIENQNRVIDIQSLTRIREFLLDFEEKYKNEKTRDGHRLIRPQYIKERIDL